MPGPRRVKVKHIPQGRSVVECDCWTIGHTGSVRRTKRVLPRDEVGAWIKEHARDHGYPTREAALAVRRKQLAAERRELQRLGEERARRNNWHRVDVSLADASCDCLCGWRTVQPFGELAVHAGREHLAAAGLPVVEEDGPPFRRGVDRRLRGYATQEDTPAAKAEASRRAVEAYQTAEVARMEVIYGGRYLATLAELTGSRIVT